MKIITMKNLTTLSSLLLFSGLASAATVSNVTFSPTPGGPLDGRVDVSSFSVTAQFDLQPVGSFLAGVVFQNAYNDFSETLGFVNVFTAEANIFNQNSQVVGQWGTHMGSSVRGAIEGDDLVIGITFNDDIQIGDVLTFNGFSADVTGTNNDDIQNGDVLTGTNWWPTNLSPYSIILADAASGNELQTTVVPEPSSSLLAVLGGFLLTIRRRNS